MHSEGLSSKTRDSMHEKLVSLPGEFHIIKGEPVAVYLQSMDWKEPDDEWRMHCSNGATNYLGLEKAGYNFTTGLAHIRVQQLWLSITAELLCLGGAVQPA
ncbi:hypothetical protein F5141DRAFT_1065746 [Pisolithus sp. B1]|nr:hypothetical protein F5141DRAFT_1065746 [Pisolithus sp. B1]